MKRKLECVWQTDKMAHSFVCALHTAMHYSGIEMQMDEVSVRTGFAFRIITHKELCPSATSVFDWNYLSEGAKNCGLKIKYISRLWHEEELKEERRKKAIEMIKNSIERGIPAVVWDVGIPEWELITGYDDEEQMFFGIGVIGNDEIKLAYDKLGEREIPILSVTIIDGKEEIDEYDALLISLQWFVNHYEKKEWCERPDYEDGYEAYLLWAKGMDLPIGEQAFHNYYACTYESLRDLGAVYLNRMAENVPELKPLAVAYSNGAKELKIVRDLHKNRGYLKEEIRKECKPHIIKAGEWEKEAYLIAKDLLPQLKEI